MTEADDPLYPEGLTQQTQPTGTTCVHTCIAMLMGVPAEEVISRVGSADGLSHMDTIIAMDRLGLIYAPLMRATLWDGWHLVSAPSLNHVGGMHAVLLYWNGDTGNLTVLDPAIGKRYSRDGSDMKSWAEVILTKPSGTLRYFDKRNPKVT